MRSSQKSNRARTSRFLVSATFSLVALHASSALALEADDDAIGTTPARGSQPVAAPTATPGPRNEIRGIRTSDEIVSIERSDPSDDAPSDADYRTGYAPVATDPPPDWAILHAGLRPKLGTFGGIATLALAHARTERFYGVFSLSGVRNDAGTHVGLAQLALGRNLADEFKGAMQLSLTENRARNFAGLGQTSLAYNRAGETVSVFQLAAVNRASSFGGGVQLGAYNRADATFSGLAQVGAFNHAKQDFTGAVQIGVLNGAGRLFDESSSRRERFVGIAQIGAVDSASTFYGVAQIGAVTAAGSKFRGLVQIGALGVAAQDFAGLAQIGAFTASKKSIGLQLGATALAFEEHVGLQSGVVANYAKSVSGAQIGVANLADEVKGVQIGLFNHARRLRGMQIGIANHAEDGLLPWTAILNFGFGEEDGVPTVARRTSDRSVD